LTLNDHYRCPAHFKGGTLEAVAPTMFLVNKETPDIILAFTDEDYQKLVDGTAFLALAPGSEDTEIFRTTNADNIHLLPESRLVPTEGEK
jgi:hypothetical protein